MMRGLAIVGAPVATLNRRIAGGVDVGARVYSNIEVLEATGISATTGGTAHTKGSWVEVSASTAADIGMLTVASGTGISAANTSTVFDIGVGAASSEVVVVPDILCGYSTVTTRYINIPVFIPAGSRVAIRVAGARTSEVTTHEIRGYSGSLPNITPAAAVSALTTISSSKGTTVAGGGSWVELVSSLSAPLSALVWSFSGDADTTVTGSVADVEIGFGAVASEIAVAQVQVTPTSTELFSVQAQAQLPWSIVGGPIPAGTRIACRNNTSQSIDVALYGLT